MPQTLIHLGHVAPSSSAEVAVGGAVPASHVWETRVWVANKTGAALTFRVRQAYADAAAVDAQYRAYDATLGANDLVALPVFPMQPTDKLYFAASGAGLICIADALDCS
jgi:hypothetical protein